MRDRFKHFQIEYRSKLVKIDGLIARLNKLKERQIQEEKHEHLAL